MPPALHCASAPDVALIHGAMLCNLPVSISPTCLPFVARVMSAAPWARTGRIECFEALFQYFPVLSPEVTSIWVLRRKIKDD
jgi:hypothetical protein